MERTTKERDFTQVAESFFRLHPDASESHLFTYIIRESDIFFDDFDEWWQMNKNTYLQS